MTTHDHGPTGSDRTSRPAPQRRPRPRRVLRHGLALATSALLLATAQTAPAAAAPGAQAPDPAAAAAGAVQQERPRAAVALGDSFISGEGAGDYQPVTDADGVEQAFPGWNAPNENAYFCHRSANASIEVAALDGIDDRFNLACSGGQPGDIADASSARERGRSVASQLDQLRAVAQTHDIDLVLIGLGSNSRHFTFGDVAAECAGRFVADGYTGWWEVWIHAINWITGASLSEKPCTDADLASAEQLSGARIDTTAAVRSVIETLDEIDADGEYRIVLQDYTNPLPEAYAPEHLEVDGRDDRRDKYRGLVRARYAAGCPAHVDSLAPAHRFSEGLGDLVSGVATTLRAERPDLDLTYLDVQDAFDGARLCEQPGGADAALATPLRVMDGPTGEHVTSLDRYDKIGIKRLLDTCTGAYQTCQESWHPSAAGHRVLGECLSQAWARGGGYVGCRRDATTGAIGVG